MGLLSIFKRKAEPIETRASGSGFTAEIIAARESYISGSRGLAELTATAQSCVSLWEGGLSMSDVTGTGLLERHTLGLIGRSLALRGEAVFLIREDGLVPASDWDLRTRMSKPTAYRISIPEAGGGRNMTVLSAEVLHVRIGADPAAPYLGQAPLRRSSLTASLLHSVESALAEVYEFAPLGSQVIPFPESSETDLDKLARGFRGRRGRVLLRESVNVSAAGGAAPQADWRPQDTSPDLSRSMTKETLDAARQAIGMAFGVLPGLANPSTTGPMVREAQRHLAQWALQPMAELIAQEATEKLGSEVSLDVMRPLQAFDAGGRARALSAVVGALATAKGAGIPADDVAKAMALVDWNEKG